MDDYEIVDIDVDVEKLDIGTKLAIQRTILSNTRTFSAWVRTGLSLVLAGFGIVKFIGIRDKYQSLVFLLGIIFVFTGIGVYIYAYLNYKKGYKKLTRDKTELCLPLVALFLLTLSLVVTALFVIALLIIFE